MSAPVAVVAAGSNLGERQATIDAAFAELAALPLVDEVRVSDTVETVAVRPDGEDDTAPRYLNAVALVHTRLAPSALLLELHRIELRHGRERRERWGDRTLDLDLVTWGAVRSDDARLVLPHPRAAEREFVLAPWAQLDSDADLPGSGRIADLLAALGERS